MTIYADFILTINRDMVEQYGNAIYRLTLRYTGDNFLAEDIAQETFLRAYAKLQSYDRSRPAGPWLFRIALNLCRNRWRDVREIPMDERVTAAEADPGPGPEHIYLQRETEQELIIRSWEMGARMMYWANFSSPSLFDGQILTPQ